MTAKVTVHYEGFDLADGEYSVTEGKTLHIWTQADGQWCCIVDDHGPFCRRCKLMEPIHAACISNVLEGHLDIFDDPDKGMMFRISESGKARVETAIRRGGFDAGLDA